MEKSLSRVIKIFFAFSKYYWQAFVIKKESRAILFRKTLEGLGSVFVKFGQFLSLHPDLIPNEYCRELFYLLENVPTFPAKYLYGTFNEDFRNTPEKMFSSFNSIPIAGASFGQVYEARLKSGEKVAVKVQRPRIQAIVNHDIKIMKFFARIIDVFPLGPNKLTPLIIQFEGWTLEELDYETEADYTEKFNKRYAEDKETIIVPKIYREFCSKRVLTEEFIEGTTISNILTAIRNNDKILLNKLKKAGFSRGKAAEMLLKTSIKQIYFDGFFHADPHPANIIFTNKGELAYIDFGIVGTLDKKSRFACLRYIRSALYGDVDSSFDALKQLCNFSKITNKESFKKEHDQVIMEMFNQIKNTGELRQVMGQKLLKTMRVMQKYKVIVPPNTLLYFRAVSTLDNTVLELNPDMVIEDVAKKFRNMSIANMIIELPTLINPDNFEKNILKWLNVIEKTIS